MGVKVRERPGKGWFVLTDWKGQRKAKFFGNEKGSKKKAERFADKLEARIKWAEQSGEALCLSRDDQTMPTVSVYLKEWLDHTAQVHCKPSTHEEYKRSIDGQLVPAFGARRLDALTRADVTKQIARWVEERKSRATIRNYLAPLKAAYFQAMDDGLVTANPVSRANRLFRNSGGRGHHVDPFTREETQTLLGKVQEQYPVLYPVVLCAVRTGLRQSELIGLEWGTVDFHGRFLEVRQSVVRNQVGAPKNHKIRRVDLSPSVLAMLQRLKETRQCEAMAAGQELAPWVFLSPRGRRWEDWELKKAWRMALAASGLRQIRFHDLRHTYASHLIDQGAHAKYVQEQLGHGSIQMTMDIYGHLFPNRNRGWVDALDAPVDKPDSETKSATPPQPVAGEVA